MDKEDVLCVYIYIYVYTHMRARAHTHTHTHTHNGIPLSHEKERNFSISRTEKDKYCMVSYVESKKYNKLVNITKKKRTHRYREQTSSYKWGVGNVGVGEWP